MLGSRRGRPLGIVLLALLVVAVLAPEIRTVRLLRLAALDTYQVRMPRTRVAAPVVIVAVDEASLSEHGQWPWPRTLLARLVDRIADAQPAVIALDFVMPEVDRLSPRHLPALLPTADPVLLAALARLEDSDTTLARALRRRPTVLGVGGLETMGVGSPALGQAPVRVTGGDPRRFVRRFGGALRSIDAVHDAAAGHGLLSVDTEGGVVRRVPLVAAIGSTLVPGLAVEMLRVASGAPGFGVQVGPRGVEHVTVGDLAIATEADGTVWVPYTPRDATRFVSARDVLAGRLEGSPLERMLVVVGVTALGASDYHATPVDERMPGAEIHAQVVEAIADGALLRSPRWARWAEAAVLLVGGLALVLAGPKLAPRRSLALLVLLVIALVLLGLVLYAKARVLFDFATPALGLAIVFTAMLGGALLEADRQRRALRRQVEVQREAAARLAGELEGARRIQMGLLPSPAAAFAGDARVTLWAFLEPARAVGGDLYDFFPLDGERVFVMVGDVSGKGLPASLFMAFTKSVCRSAALRRGGHLAQVLDEVNRELSRENPEGLYVTLVAVVLDARTGALEYCAAGHDAPYLLRPGGGEPRRLAGAGGLPVGVADGAAYATGRHRMAAGEMVCLLTDGVADAESASGDFYGRRRLETVLGGLPADASPETVGTAIRADVERFTAGVDAADDVAIVVLRWNGPDALSGR